MIQGGLVQPQMFQLYMMYFSAEVVAGKRPGGRLRRSFQHCGGASKAHEGLKYDAKWWSYADGNPKGYTCAEKDLDLTDLTSRNLDIYSDGHILRTP